MSCNLYWRAMRTLRARLSLLRSFISRRFSCILAIRTLCASSDGNLEICDLARGMAKAPNLRKPAVAAPHAAGRGTSLRLATNSSVSFACSVCSARYSRVVSSVFSVPPPPPPSCEPCSVAKTSPLPPPPPLCCDWLPAARSDMDWDAADWDMGSDEANMGVANGRLPTADAVEMSRFLKTIGFV